MPQNKTYLSALDKSKLDKIKEVELSEAKKIHLSIIDDAKVMANELSKNRQELNDLSSNADEVDDEIREANRKGEGVFENLNSAIADASDTIDDARTVLIKLEDGAEALGLAPQDIQEYKQLSDAREETQAKLDDAEDTVSNLGDLIGR